MVIMMEQLNIYVKDSSEDSLRLIKEHLEECCFLKKRVEITLDCGFIPSYKFMYKVFTLFLIFK